MTEKNEMKEKENKAPKIASLVLGIVSIITTLFYYVAVPTGVLAIVFGVLSIKKYDSKMGKAGMILGIIGLSLTTIIYGFVASAIILSNF